LIEALKNIPANVWSVLLGSLIAYLGVLISNWHNNKRLLIQLKHDAELRSIERKALMRREVYLSAAEELVKANSFLGSLAQMDLAKTNIGAELQGLFTSAAKLGLIAEEETGSALNELMLAYSSLLFRLLIKVSPISDSKNSISTISYHYEESQLEIKRILAAMTNQNESGAPNTIVFDSLSSLFDFQSKASKELTEERDELWKNVTDLTSDFAVVMANEMKSIALLQVPVMVGIRKELELETDIETYKQQVVSNTDKLSKLLDDFIAEIKKQA